MRFAIFFALLVTPSAALADLVRITDRAEFVGMVAGRTLSAQGANLNVTDDGSISGRALGFGVTGDWTWEDGLFCRTLDTSVRSFPRNCQMVSVNGDTMRFQSDAGTGDLVDFTLR